MQQSSAEPTTFTARQSIAYSAGNVSAGLIFSFANAALPFYLASYGLPNALIGLLAQDRPPLAGVLQLVVGALSDRTRTRLGRRRPYILFGIPVTALALLALSQRPPVWIMVALLVLMTSSLAVAYGPYLALLPDLVPSRQRGRVGAVLAVGNMIGQISLLMLAAQLWPQQQTLVFILLAVALVVGFGLSFLAVGEPSSVAAPTPKGPSLRDYVRDLLSRREVVKYLVATLFFWLGTGSVIPFLTRFAVNELGTTEGEAFQLLMVAIISTALFTLPAGWLGDRYGKKPVLLLGLLLFGVSILIGSQVRTIEQAAAALVFTGAANAVSTALLFPLLADLIPGERAGEFTGLGSAVWELAQPLGAVLGGLAADLTGTFRTTLVLAGLLTLVSGLLLAPVRTQRNS